MDWSTDYLTVDRPTNWQSNWSRDWLTDCLCDLYPHQLTVLLTDRPPECGISQRTIQLIVHWMDQSPGSPIDTRYSCLDFGSQCECQVVSPLARQTANWSAYQFSLITNRSIYWAVSKSISPSTSQTSVYKSTRQWNSQLFGPACIETVNWLVYWLVRQ